MLVRGASLKRDAVLVPCRLGILVKDTATEMGSMILVEMMGSQGSRAQTAALGHLGRQMPSGTQNGLTHRCL